MGLFYSGKVYMTRYTNWKHDSMPLVWVLHSDAYKTHAINIHYFSQPLLMQFIQFIKLFNQKFDMKLEADLGRSIYRIIKKYYPYWAKQGYRTYHTNMLNGYLINEGITKPLQSIMQPTTTEDQMNKDLMAKNLNDNSIGDVVAEKMPSKPDPTNYLGMK